MSPSRWLLAWAALVGLGGVVRTAPPTPADVEFFEKQVRPVLVEKCLSCHGDKKQKAGLRLDSRGGLLKGSEGGPVVVPGQPDKSPLIHAVQHSGDSRMPPSGKLSLAAIQALSTWVKMGAPWPDAGTETQDPEKSKKHWAFQPLGSAPLRVAAKQEPDVTSPIDRFIRAKLAEKGLKPVGPADKRTLIRRATFDLTGLPPTPEEIDAFLADDSPGAFAKVVDRLLASPHYGERWCRHWLDVVRYADTSGNASDFPVPQAYRYRNYVISSFNQDKPYDQFLREQIAGDLLTPADRAETAALGGALKDEAKAVREAALEALVAPGVDARNAIPPLAKALQNPDEAIRQAAATALVHIHPDLEEQYPAIAELRDRKARIGERYDNLLLKIYAPQDAAKGPAFSDHAGLYGPSDPIPEYAGHKDIPKGYWVYVYPYWYVWGEQKSAETGADRFDRIVATGYLAIHRRFGGEDAPDHLEAEDIIDMFGRSFLGLALSCARCHDHKFDPISTRDYYGLYGIFSSSRYPFTGAEGRVKQKHFVPLEKGQDGYAVSEGKPADAAIHKGGDPSKPGALAPRGFPRILGDQKLGGGAAGSGRRQLAEWLVAPQNPLTARVMVNRIWLNHFGKGLVQTPNDFGARGQPPTHPELLDYLALRFIENGWSIKAMHRLIMLSQTYQQASSGRPENAGSDPNNDWLWKFPRRRLDAESIRDALLASSGELDRGMGEGHPFPPQDKWNFTQHTPFNALYDSNRRSVYLMQQRLKRHPFLALFDGADPNASTPDRSATTTPVQALYWMNDPFVHHQADRFAKRLLGNPDEDQRLKQAYELALGRPPTPVELMRAKEYLPQFAAKAAAAGIPADRQQRAAWASLARVLYGSNEFLYVD